MVTPSDEQSGQTPDSADDAMDQDAVDAPLSGAAGDAAPEPSHEVSQADIDALLSAAGEDAEGPEAPAEQDGVPPESDARVDTQGRPFDEAAAAMQAAMENEEAATAQTAASAPTTPGAPPADTTPFTMPEFSLPEDLNIDAKRVTMLNDVNLRVKIELGRTRMLVEDVLALGEGSVVELDKLAGDPVDVYVNNRLVARGEVLVLNDNFCVRISEVLSRDPHRVSA